MGWPEVQKLKEHINMSSRQKIFDEDGTWIVPDCVTQIKISGCGSGKGIIAGQPMVRKLCDVIPGEVISFSVGMDDELGYKDTVISSDSIGTIILYAGTFSKSIANDLIGIPLGVSGANGGAGGSCGSNPVGGAGGSGGYGGYFGIGGGGAGGGGAFSGGGYTSGGGGGAGGYSNGGGGGGQGSSVAGTNSESHPLANNGCAGNSATDGKTKSTLNASYYNGGKGADAGNGCYYGAGGGAGGGNGGNNTPERGYAGTGGKAGKPSGGMVMIEW